MIKHVKAIIPTYEPGSPEPLPMFFEKKQNQGTSAKVYPLPYTSSLSDRKIDKQYDTYILENSYVKVTLLPEIGGKIKSILDKTNNYDIIYNNPVIKPAMVGLCGPWVSGGIEFNWPQHHRPTTFMPLEAKQVGEAVYMGEVERFQHMQGMVGISLEEGHSYVKAHCIVYNSTPFTNRFMWWANTAVEINDHYAVDFPPDVNYVNDHDRRCVLSWPIAKGKNETARPWDYKDGSDIHFTRSIIPPSSFMISKDHCDYGFIAGYDYGKKAGVVMFGDPSVSVGKKLWTWGNNPFGKKWCENLTDNGSQYCELMTGVYCDNQPDFSMIEPYEMKVFDQYWYPIREIGEPKCATLAGALNLEKTEKGIRLGIHMSGSYPQSHLSIRDQKKSVLSKTVDLTPEHPFIEEIPFTGDFQNLTVAIQNEKKEQLIAYSVRQKVHDPISPRPISPRPQDIKSLEELYLHGYHLYQYDHFSYVPEDYFLEALRRDPTDARCNEAMGDLSLKKGRFQAAKEYYGKAIEKLLLRDANPRDTSAYYKRGLTHRYLGEQAEAISDFNHATWQYATKAASYYALAGYEAMAGRKARALELLNLSLESNYQNVFAHYLKYVLDNDQSELVTIQGIDPLFFVNDTANKTLFYVRELMNFGQYSLAIKLLDSSPKNQMVFYYLAYLYRLIGEETKANEFIQKGNKESPNGDFPNDLEDAIVLNTIDTPMTSYYLGCMNYHWENWKEAAIFFEKTIEKIPYAPAYRNLSLAYFDHLDRKEDSYKMLEKAFKLCPTSSRIFYELTALQTSLAYPVKDRIAFIEEHNDLLYSRDDVLLRYVIYLTLEDRYEEASKVLKEHSFHTYEGGEGQLTSLHSNLMFLAGLEKEKEGRFEEALKDYQKGLVYPENYHETVTLHVDNSQLFYSIGKLLKKQGQEDLAKTYFEKGCSSLAFPNPNFYFAYLSALELGDEKMASSFLEKLLAAGQDALANKDLDAYFGVGAPARMPFAYDVKKTNTIKGLELELFAFFGLRQTKATQEVAKELVALDPSSMVLKIYEKIKSDFPF